MLFNKVLLLVYLLNADRAFSQSELYHLLKFATLNVGKLVCFSKIEALASSMLFIQKGFLKPVKENSGIKLIWLYRTDFSMISTYQDQGAQSLFTSPPEKNLQAL